MNQNLSLFLNEEDNFIINLGLWIKFKSSDKLIKALHKTQNKIKNENKAKVVYLGNYNSAKTSMINGMIS